MFLKKCAKCERYTLKDKCPLCEKSTASPHPLKFSIEKEKKYAKYRREALK